MSHEGRFEGPTVLLAHAFQGIQSFWCAWTLSFTQNHLLSSSSRLALEPLSAPPIFWNLMLIARIDHDTFQQSSRMLHSPNYAALYFRPIDVAIHLLVQQSAYRHIFASNQV